MVLDTSLLNIQYYKVCIKGKVANLDKCILIIKDNIFV